MPRPSRARALPIGASTIGTGTLAADPAPPDETVDSELALPAHESVAHAALSLYEPNASATSIAQLEAFAERQPDDPTAPHLLAQIAADRGRHDHALYWAFVALQRDPLHVPTRVLVGLVHFERGDPERARKSFRQASFLDPLAPEPHLFLSAVLATSGDDRGAARARARAVALAQDAPEPQFPVERARLGLRTLDY